MLCITGDYYKVINIERTTSGFGNVNNEFNKDASTPINHQMVNKARNFVESLKQAIRSIHWIDKIKTKDILGNVILVMIIILMIVIFVQKFFRKK